MSLQQGLRLTYRELLNQADEVARGLLALGVQVWGQRQRGVGRGDRELPWIPVACMRRLG